MQHNDDPILSLKSPNKLYITFLNFLLLCSYYVADFAAMQTQAKCYYSSKMLPLISSVGSSYNTKKLFLQLSAWDDELLSTPKITTFLANELQKLHETAPSNA